MIRLCAWCAFLVCLFLGTADCQQQMYCPFDVNLSSFWHWLWFRMLYTTKNTCSAAFGCYGFDICKTQSVAIRFTPSVTANLTSIFITVMSNANLPHPTVNYTLCSNAPSVNDTTPLCAHGSSGTVLEVWNDIEIPTEGWVPVNQTISSTKQPLLQQTGTYWVVAESDARCGHDGIWIIVSETGFVATKEGHDDWMGGDGGAVAITVFGVVAK